MKGLYINHGGKKPYSVPGLGQSGLTLLARHPDLEIMQQNIHKGATVWLIPSEKESDLEFFYVHAGKIGIEVDGRTEIFEAGDSFHVRGLEKELYFTTMEDTQLVYISTAVVFETENYFQTDLQAMVQQINDKDDYTYRHSRNVMRYALALYRELQDLCENVTTNDIVVAGLFHDIGKIKIPDEILKKKGRLEKDEYDLMKKHSLFGADILSQYFEHSIVELALRHHERLDGSGYPLGVGQEDISFAARILSVVDAFDAMTTDRGYNRVMSFEDAARELVSLPTQYEPRVTEKLLEMVLNGELISPKEP